jgi:hypothetical protein
MTNVDSVSPANGLLGQARMVRHRRIKMTIFDRFLGFARNDSGGISNPSALLTSTLRRSSVQAGQVSNKEFRSKKENPAMTPDYDPCLQRAGAGIRGQAIRRITS